MGTVVPQAPVLSKGIQRSSNIKVVNRHIQVPHGGTGSSVIAVKYKRETPAASQRAVPLVSITHLRSYSHTGPWTLDSVRPETGSY